MTRAVTAPEARSPDASSQRAPGSSPAPSGSPDIPRPKALHYPAYGDTSGS